ncbi:hypothetical protein N601_09785 [Rhodococcus erythropolis DN1]|nr:hypothetical protein N601_09785 [Rhodococcus erythropolis DN1]
MGTKEDSATRERKALRYSLVVATALAVVAAFWGWISQSQVILLDGVYALIGMVLTALSLRVSRIADSGPTARFPFGKEALIPVVIAVQGMALLATLAYAAVEAVRVILAGGATSPRGLWWHTALSAQWCRSSSGDTSDKSTAHLICSSPKPGNGERRLPSARWSQSVLSPQ